MSHPDDLMKTYSILPLDNESDEFVNDFKSDEYRKSWNVLNGHAIIANDLTIKSYQKEIEEKFMKEYNVKFIERLY